MSRIRAVRSGGLLVPVLLALLAGGASADPPARLESIRISADGRGFVRQDSGKSFRPWGFNYDHDATGRLIEDYWHTEWPLVESHFRAMRRLGANVVRIHLQFGRFCPERGRLDADELDRLESLVHLAEQEGLHLDLTGLGCYHKKDVPAWYDDLSESERWEAQADFWKGIADRVGRSPAIFCYDLMNEPVVSGGKRSAGDWLGPPFAGKHFVQFVSLDPGERTRPEVARAWIETLVAAIRTVDPDHLITVGLVDWSLDRPGLTSGFIPAQVCDRLDFLCVHLYPERGQRDRSRETLRLFAAVGKPVVIEETFPLRCGIEEFETFLDDSAEHAAGVIGFFWGEGPADLRPPKTVAQALTLGWLELFERRRPPVNE